MRNVFAVYLTGKKKKCSRNKLNYSFAKVFDSARIIPIDSAAQRIAKVADYFVTLRFNGTPEQMNSIPGEVIPLVAIGGGILLGIVALVCATVHSIYKTHRQSNLKQMMLEAGLPPHDIERVINCGLNEQKPEGPAGKGPMPY